MDNFNLSLNDSEFKNIIKEFHDQPFAIDIINDVDQIKENSLFDDNGLKFNSKSHGAEFRDRNFPNQTYESSDHFKYNEYGIPCNNTPYYPPLLNVNNEPPQYVDPLRNTISPDAGYTSGYSPEGCGNSTMSEDTYQQPLSMEYSTSWHPPENDMYNTNQQQGQQITIDTSTNSNYENTYLNSSEQYNHIEHSYSEPLGAVALPQYSGNSQQVDQFETNNYEDTNYEQDDESEPYLTDSRISLSNLSDEQKYKRHRFQNNKASKVYREKRKTGIKQLEKELERLTLERDENEQKFISLDKQSKECIRLLKNYIQFHVKKGIAVNDIRALNISLIESDTPDISKETRMEFTKLLAATNSQNLT